MKVVGVLWGSIALLFLLVPRAALGEARVEKNVVYGMYSGLALLMDVHRPERPNGYGLLLFPGSGFHTSQAYDGASIKDGGSALFVSVPTLLNSGYTLFIANHRSAPRFRYPAAVEDAQRAVRFVRFHAADYGISAERIGAVGYSSGAYLSAFVGLLDGTGDVADPDEVNRVSAHVQCVVASAAPADLAVFQAPNATSFIGAPSPSLPGAPRDPIAAKAYYEASPVNHLSAQSAPLLLIHGDADTTVPFEQSESMVAAAKKAGSTVKLVRVPGGGHRFAMELAKHPAWPDVMGETVSWLEKHLKNASSQR